MVTWKQTARKQFNQYNGKIELADWHDWHGCSPFKVAESQEHKLILRCGLFNLQWPGNGKPYLSGQPTSYLTNNHHYILAKDVLQMSHLHMRNMRSKLAINFSIVAGISQILNRCRVQHGPKVFLRCRTLFLMVQPRDWTVERGHPYYRFGKTQAEQMRRRLGLRKDWRAGRAVGEAVWCGGERAHRRPDFYMCF